jgi:hypothetical protein
VPFAHKAESAFARWVAANAAMASAPPNNASLRAFLRVLKEADMERVRARMITTNYDP